MQRCHYTPPVCLLHVAYAQKRWNTDGQMLQKEQEVSYLCFSPWDHPLLREDQLNVQWVFTGGEISKLISDFFLVSVLVQAVLK